MKMKKMGTFLLAALMAFGCGACGELPEIDIDQTEEIDPNRTQLYVGMFNGALGRAWMDELDRQYEELHPDIQVIVTPGKSEFEDGTLLVQIAQSQNDIYFLSSNTYSTFVESNLLEPLTDTITEKIYDEDGNFASDTGKAATQSILDTMYDPWKDLFKTDDNQYYAIPNWMSTPGIVYDADLFEDYGYEVPETYEELIDLMDTMVNDKLTPFVFSTMDYITLNSLYYMYAQYEGLNDFYLNSTFKGTDSTLGEINYQNAYLLQTQEGKKASLQFAHDLARTDAYTTSTTKAGLTHLAAQGEFVRSINTKETGSQRVAMLLENSYWEREVKGTIDDMGKITSKYGWGARNFRYMLAPTFEDSTNTKHTVFGSTSNSYVCINKSRPEASKEIAKDFLQFVQSRKGLVTYVQNSGCLRAFKFTMTPEEYAACTPFTQSIYDLTQRSDVEFVCFGKINPILRKQTTDFDYNWMFYTEAETAVGGGGDGTVPVIGRSAFTMFRSYPRLTVQEYFDGFASAWDEDDWQLSYYDKLDDKYKA